MRRTTWPKTVLSVAVILLALGIGRVVYLLSVPVELPEVGPKVEREVHADLHLRDARIGRPIGEFYERFGRAAPANSEGLERCVLFVYDPDLFEGALVLHVRMGRIVERWLVSGEAAPGACSALAVERVDLKGWYSVVRRR